jgi:hypothetical protein
MNITSHSEVARLFGVIAATLVVVAPPASAGSVQIPTEALQQCVALSNSVRRLTCFDLLVKLRVEEPAETIGRGEGVTISLRPELISELDTWIESRPEPKPSRSEAIRQILESTLR